MHCVRCGRNTHVQADCYAKTHLDGTGLHTAPYAKSPNRIAYETSQKKREKRRAEVKEDIKSKGLQFYMPPPVPGSKTKKRVWYFMDREYRKDKTGEFKLSGENPYWSRYLSERLGL